MKFKLIDQNIDRLGRFPAENHLSLSSSVLLEKKNDLYKKDLDDWSSLEMTLDSKHLITKYFDKEVDVLEVGSGTGNDLLYLYQLGYNVCGIEKSKIAIERNSDEIKSNVECGDFFSSNFNNRSFNMYEKGVYHNLIREERKLEFVRKVASHIDKGGYWINISGCYDSYNSHLRFGRIKISELISIVEPYFVVQEIKRAPYGKIKGWYDFEAWYSVLKRK